MTPPKDHPWRKPVVSEAQREMRERWRGYKAAQRGREAVRLEQTMAQLGETGATRNKRRLKPWVRLAPSVRKRRLAAWSRRVMYELAEQMRQIKEDLQTLTEYVDRLADSVAKDDADRDGDTAKTVDSNDG